jgi:hypothetical protein
VNLFQDLTISSLFSWRFNWTAISSKILRDVETSGTILGASGLEFDAKKNSCSFKGMGLGYVLWRVGVLVEASVEENLMPVGEDILLHQRIIWSGQ